MYLRYPLNFLTVVIRAIGDDFQGADWPGSSPCLGGVGSSGECAAAVAEVVFRRWGRHRAGTRPAPTGALRRKGKAACAGVLGQAQGLPLQVRWGRKGRRRVPAYLGRHKACPYGSAEEERDGGVCRDLGRHKACPYRTFGGRAGTRPAPTGPLGGRAGTRPAPTGALGEKGKAACAGVLGQAQGLPLRER